MSRWGDLAEWRGTSHHGGPMLEHRGLVVHIAEGTYEGTIAWQQGDNSVSSHFVVDRDGKIAQVVDTDVTAWTQRSGNGHWLSVECAGFTKRSAHYRDGWEVLDERQVAAIGKLLDRAHHQYGVPLQLATAADGRGLGHHSMGGASWGHRDCPGVPIIAQKPAIIAAARKLEPAPKPAVKPRPTLQRGDKGTAVHELQGRANRVPETGADVAQDSDFGPATEAKIKRVQHHFGLAADGIAGPKTWGKLGVKW